jgi:hypothetical protein
MKKEIFRKSLFEKLTGSNDWTKTLKKFGVNVLVIFLSGLLSYFKEDILYVSLAPLILALIDWLKHR